MHVEVVVRGERVGVRFDVRNTQAHHVLLREMPQLKENLEGRGFAVHRAEVYLAAGQGESSHGQGASWGAGGGSAGESFDRSGKEEGTERVAAASRAALDIEV